MRMYKSTESRLPHDSMKEMPTSLSEQLPKIFGNAGVCFVGRSMSATTSLTSAIEALSPFTCQPAETINQSKIVSDHTSIYKHPSPLHHILYISSNPSPSIRRPLHPSITSINQHSAATPQLIFNIVFPQTSPLEFKKR